MTTTSAAVRRFARPRVMELMNDPSPTPQHPVVATYLYEGFELGKDEGVVTFSEGWLIFTGLRSHFSIRVGDLVSIDSRDEPSYSFFLRISRQRPTKNCLLVPMKFAEVGGRKEFDLDFRFAESMKKWLREKQWVEGEAMLPVATMPPDDLSARKTAARRTAAEATGLASLGAAVVIYWNPMVGFAMLAGAVVASYFLALKKGSRRTAINRVLTENGLTELDRYRTEATLGRRGADA